MWNWLNCYLSGRHDFGVTCSSGSIYLCCIHCGKRSNGWSVHNEQPAVATVAAPVPRPHVTRGARALPFVQRDVVREQRTA